MGGFRIYVGFGFFECLNLGPRVRSYVCSGRSLGVQVSSVSRGDQAVVESLELDIIWMIDMSGFRIRIQLGTGDLL